MTAVLVVLLAACSTSTTLPPPPRTAATAPVDLSAPGVRHLEYVFPAGSMQVFDVDHDLRLVESVPLPTGRGVRGVAASVVARRVFVSYGGDGGRNGNGSLLAYDLSARTIVWTRHFAHGVDSMAASDDGSRIFVPGGEGARDGRWYVLDGRSGRQVGVIHGGAGAHNTVIGASGRFVYLGGRDHDFLVVADERTGAIVRRVGPLRAGVRPFTVNGRETIAYTTATGFLGFQVCDLRTGRVLFTQDVPGFGWDPRRFATTAPSHGISLSPAERELYVMDAPNAAVHVFDVSGVPDRPPRLVATVPTSQPMIGDESPCGVDCARDGWLRHSRDGRLVFVGDAGDVIGTRAHRVVATLPVLRDTKKSIEIDWVDERPVFTTSRYGLGHVR